MFFLENLTDLPPLEIANTTIIMPDRFNNYNSGVVRDYIKSSLKNDGKNAAFLPQITTLYDLARQISGFSSGNEIREADFSVLLTKDISGLIPPRFNKKENRAYRKHLLKMLDLLSLEDDNFYCLPKQSVEGLKTIGLTYKSVQYVYDMVRYRGYHFLGEIYRTAIEKINKDNSLINKEKFLLIHGGFYSKLEIKLLNLLGFSAKQILEIQPSGKWSSFTNVLVNGALASLESQSLEYLKADSIADQTRQVIHDIAEKLQNDKSLKLSDFSIICQTGESLARITATLQAINLPFAAPFQIEQTNALTLALTALRLGMDADVSALNTFFNLYCDHQALIEMDLKQAGEEMTIADLEKTLTDKNQELFNISFVKDEEKRQADLFKFKNFLEAVKSNSANNIIPTHVAIDNLAYRVKKIISLLKSDDKEANVYGFKTAVEDLFGQNISENELLEYLIEIAGKNSNPLKQNFDGINVVTVKDCLLASKICYLIDLEESKFLRWNEYNRLLDRDKYNELEKVIFGRTKEEFIINTFNSIWQNQAEKIVFVLPVYDESTIITTRFDNILQCYPQKLKQIIINNKEIAGEFNFSYEFDELLKNDIHQPVKMDSISINENIAGLAYNFPVDDLKKYLKSASNIEKFMLCPANFVSSLKSEYNEITSMESFVAGRFLHEIVQDFLEFFKNQDLLEPQTYERVRFDFVNEKNTSGFNNTILENFVGFYLYDKLVDAKESFSDLENIFATYGLKNKLNERIDSEPDSTKVYRLEKDNQLIVSFLVKLLCEIGPTPASVTSTILTELQFGNFEILPNIIVKKGFMDLVLINNEGQIRLFDLKSGKIDVYSDEMKEFQIVQLEIYREVLTRALKYNNFYCFDNIEKPNDDRKYSRLTDCYKSCKQSEVFAAYLSSKDVFKAELSPDFEGFKDKLADLTGCDKFYPLSNHSCNYCNLKGGCDKFDLSCINLAEFEVKGFKHFAESYTDFAQFPTKIDAKNNNSIVNSKTVVQFEPNSQQEKAVKLLRENIVISAGAGAGKTEVLSARYINLILNDDVDIDQIVCITFTNKAVGEMQKRIYSKLNDCIATKSFFTIHNIDVKYQLTEFQLDKLIKCKANFFKRNRITTFHAFCKQLLDRYGSQAFADYDLENSLAPDYVLSDNLKKIAKNKHRNGYADYLANQLAENDLQTFNNWLKGQNFYYEGGFGNSSGGFFAELISLINRVNLSPNGFGSINPDSEVFNQLKEWILENTLKAEYDNNKNTLLGLAENLKVELPQGDNRLVNLSAIVGQIRNDDYTFTGNACRRRNTDHSQLLLAIETFFDFKKELEKSLYLSAIKENANEAEEAVIRQALYYIAQGLNSDLEEFKKEKGILEQNDFHQRLIKLLESNHNLLAEIQNGIKYFLLDEFQDTNWLQDKLIKLLFVNGKNFLFIVGDLKQSIYRFQQCDNNIFMNYIQGGHTYLSFKENWRSEKNIIDFNNKFFSQNINENYNIFKTTAKDANYPELAVFPKQKPNSEIQPIIRFVQIFSNTKKAKKDEVSDTNLSQSEINQIIRIKEAEYICQTILKNQHCKLEQFGILIRSYSKIDYLLEMLKFYNIPYSFTMKRGLLSRPECLEFYKIIKVVSGLLDYSEIEYIPRIDELVAKIKLNDELAIYPLVERILQDPVLLDYVQRDIEFQSRMDNLRALAELVLEADNLFVNPAEKFEHLDKLFIQDAEGIETSGANAVKIMTVHSSKGLEFDNLFLANLGERDNSDKDYLPFVNLSNKNDRTKPNFVEFSTKGFKQISGEEKKYWFAKYLKAENSKLDEAESANLLYVALTRAKKNIIVTMQKTGEKQSDDTDVNWLKNIDGNLFKDTSQKIEYDGHYLSVLREEIGIESLLSATDRAKNDIFKPIRPIFDLPITNEDIVATLFDKTETDDSKINSEAKELGNLVHKFMEDNLPQCLEKDFDFNNMIKKLTKEQMVNKEQLSKASDMISGILNSFEFKELMQNSDKLLKEQSLVLVSSNKTIYGIADLLIFKDNQIIIVDYKTCSTMPDNAVIQKYRNQLMIYKKALMGIFTDKEINCKLMFISQNSCEIIKIQ